MTAADTAQPMVRALFRAVPPPAAAGDQPAIYTKLYYPALYSGTHEEKNTGMLPANAARAPFPIAILMPGINVSPDSYAWLATALAEAGFAALLYGWICEELPGMTALSPGLDVGALKPGAYAARSSATALPALLDDLAAQNASGPLAGQLDLSRILLGGHSAGGSTALFNARPDWFPGLAAVFAYGAHSQASTMLGHPAGTLLTLPDALPTLILGGSEDGVIAASAFRYQEDAGAPDPTGPVVRTFEQALPRKRDDCHLAIVRGANHFSMAFPADPATGRPFLDGQPTRPEHEIRADLSGLILAFARAYVAGDETARDELRQRLADGNGLQRTATR